MKKLCIILTGILLLTPLFVTAQITAEEEVEEKSCEIFNPSVYENPDREPLRDELKKYLGNMDGKVLADIGAGAGYFSMDYAKNAKYVIATELNELLVDYMHQKKDKMGLDNFEVILARDKFSELEGKEIDLVLMVDVYHELDDPKVLIPALKQHMTSNGKIVIVESHISPKIVTDYLLMSGFAQSEINTFEFKGSCGLTEVNIITASVSEDRRDF